MTLLALVLTRVGGSQDDDVAAGGMAFLVFVVLGVAVALLGWSLARQLRKAQRAKDAGVYGDPPVTPAEPPEEPPEEPAGDRSA